MREDDRESERDRDFARKNKNEPLGNHYEN